MNTEKKRILFISQSAVMNNGAERCLLTLLKRLNKNKFTPVVVLPFAGRLKGALDGLGVRSYVSPLKPWVSSNISGTGTLDERCGKIADIITEEGIGIVHSNTSTIIEGAIAAKMTGRPHVWHLHEMLDGHPWLKLLFPTAVAYRFIDFFSDSVVVVSSALERSVKGYMSSSRLKLIYNGIEEPEEIEKEKSIRKELGILQDELLICTIGPIRSEKGYHTFVDAAERVLKKQKAVFIAIGNTDDFGLKKELENKIKRAAIDDSIKFLGYRDDTARILKEIDIYVVASLSESFGLAPVEAMAAGKPVIATRCGGPEEVIEDGKTGILISVNDSDAMANAIVRLSEDKDLRTQLGVKGRERYRARFSAVRYCDEFEVLYSSINGRRVLDADDERTAGEYIDLLKNFENTLATQAGIFQNSYSWKTTAPLRWCMEKIKRENVGQ